MISLFSKTVYSVLDYLAFSDNKYQQNLDDISDSESNDGECTGEWSSRDVHGVVTNLNPSERFGFVNGDIYFSYDAVADNRHPRVGDKVIATTKRLSENEPWKATVVFLVEEFWDEVDTKTLQKEEKALNFDSTTGLVISVNKDFIELEKGIKIFRKNIKCLDFVPIIGDVIIFSIEDSKIQPSRFREFNGEITKLKSDGTGTINNEVWFNPASCFNGFRPRRGAHVFVYSIESHQETLLWRAIKVVPTELQRAVPNNAVWISKKSPVQSNFLRNLLSDKEGVCITNMLDFGVLIQGVKGYITVHIENCSQNIHTLQLCRFQRKESEFSLGPIHVLQNDCSNPINSTSVILPPNAKAYVNIFCNATSLGRCLELLLFEFQGFEIGRHVSVHVKHSQEEMLPSLSHTSRKLFNRQENDTHGRLQDKCIIPGEKPFRSRHYLPYSLPMFAVPEKLRITVLEKGDIALVSPALTQDLTMENYSDRFSALLHLEEIQTQLNMYQFDMFDVCLSPMGSEYLSLCVPGLVEGRPSLLIGDKVYLKAPSGIPGPVYQGFIHEVLMEHVLIKFHSTFHSKYSGESYDISFEVSRTGMRRCHQAVQQVKSLVSPDVLFPVNIQVKQPIYQSMTKMVWFNKQLNTRQKSAVQRILGHQCRPMPYVIFGPPGTGKTVTLVEAALQVFKCLKSSRIIICAPTNSAADLITMHLHKSDAVDTNSLARLNAFQRSRESIPESIRKYCYFGDQDLSKVSYHRILVSTCSNIGILYSLKLNTGHFTHLFVDESGQTTEPECLVAMELVSSLGIDAQIILAGDPKQLGPVLSSKYAIFYGLGTSLLERLMSMRLYNRDESKFSDHGNFDPLLVTKLVQNYRSHPAILKVYSDLFYHNELQPSATNWISVLWDRLQNKDFPLLFHGLKGEELRESDSPSFFNPSEVVQTVTYLQELYDLQLEPDNIGIITPYKKQVEKIKFMCERLGVNLCKIGSVEEFQGQEKDVILLSTVRSVEVDLKDYHCNIIGFVGQSKRFNVAVSRAKSLLILIGDPDVLARDENWSSLLKYCISNRAYVGCNTEELDQ